MNRNAVLESEYNRLYEMLCKRAYAKLRCVDLSQDAVQETFARALKFWPEGGPAKSVGGWLNTIFNNTVNDILNVERNKGVTVEYDEEYDEGEEMCIEPSRLMKILRKEVANKKDPNVRAVLHLHFEKNYTLKEIDQVSELTYANIRKIVSRFKKELKVKHG